MVHRTGTFTNWNRYPTLQGTEWLPSYRSELEFPRHWIPRGNGRCYGDASLSEHMLNPQRMDHIVAFDAEHGIITAQAGILLSELIQFLVPRGFFLPVTPGTQFVSLGGVIAADVHGKNHHVDGCISNHISELELVTPDGSVHLCSPDRDADFFWATAGGMGLTGLILTATLRLKRIETAYIRQETVRTKNLEETFKVCETSNRFTYTVAWLDCLQGGKGFGRGLVYRGEHAHLEELPGRYQRKPLRLPSDPSKKLPFHWVAPFFQNTSARLFNQLYYHRPIRETEYTHLVPFFYPLDAFRNWNMAYGKNGFFQYQFVLPKDQSFDGLQQILGKIRSHKGASFLSVLKLFGPERDPAFLSFPKAGYTLSLDFKRVPGLEKLLDELDVIVHERGGRIYLAKDGRMQARWLESGYPELGRFRELMHRMDPENRIQSVQSRRLNLYPHV